MIILFLALIGLCVGSFLGVLIDRLPQEKSVVFDRSVCDYCGKKLSWNVLIPVVSYLWYKGKSACCHKRLSPFYPTIEILTAILFVVSYLFASSLLLTGVYWIVGSILLVIFFTDLFAGVVPVLLVLIGIVVLILYYLLVHAPFPSLLLGIVISGGLFGLLTLLTRGKGMGLGDVSYALLMGLILGFPNIITGLYIAFLTGAVVSLILVIAKKKKLRGGTVPFLPFLIIATVLTYIYGSPITAYFATYFPHF